MSGLSRLYPGHVPTTCGQKALLALSSSVLAMIDPRRADEVARFGEVTAGPSLRLMRDKMMKSPSGRAILKDRPCVRSVVNLPALSCLPEDTFGHSYARFMMDRSLTPESRTPVRYVDDEELAYVMKRYRDVHDFWHVLFGVSSISVVAEIGLKWVEMLHTGLPMTALASLVAPSRLPFSQQAHLVQHVLPWALRNARAGGEGGLMSVHYEAHFEEPLEDFRASLDILPIQKK